MRRSAKSGAVYLVAMLVFIAGCATSPVAEQSLENARAAYQAAAADPHVRSLAAAELAQAERRLAEAEALARDGADPEIVAHVSYLATQHARIAREAAVLRMAEASVASASEQRNRILIEAREREAEAAIAQARQAEIARREAELQLAEAQKQQSAATGATVASAAAPLDAEVKRLQAEVTELQAAQTERGLVLTLRNDVLFDAGSSTLKPGAQRAIDNLAQFLKKEPERDIGIEGFTDSTGTADANQRLSERRARSVKDALVSRGVDAARLQARGLGPAFPIASNQTQTGRQLNRRVEIVINPS